MLLSFYVIKFHNLADMDNIDVIDGRAEFVDSNTILIHQSNGELKIVGEKIFINTGAQTVLPPISGLTTTPGVYDSTGILIWTFTNTLRYLGGGYIGVEFASMFANFGSKVTIFEAAPLFLPRERSRHCGCYCQYFGEQGRYYSQC